MPHQQTMRITRRQALCGGALLGGLALSGASTGASARPLANPDPREIVETTLGKVRGTIADDIRIFRGIPYGAPTNGARRFAAPSPAAPWTGIRDTLAYGNQCVQERVTLAPAGTPGGLTPRETSDLIPVWSTAQSEDCLNLNIWTPGTGPARRPVMVWLHPGGFEFGSANIAFSEGTNLARRGDVVVVSINHRLGPFGFLHLAELGGSRFAHAGNAGMLDLVLALEWVRDNIAAFGGDPGCVMLFGESGGARKVATLLAMPAARNLFHRAAIQSGPALRFPSSGIQTRRAAYTLAELGLEAGEVSRLADVPAIRLLQAANTATARVRREIPADAPFYETYGLTPVLGPDLPAWPFDPEAPAMSDGVPILIGSNRHEMSLAFTQDRSFDEVSEEQLIAQVRSRAGREAGKLLQVYRESYPAASRRDLLLMLTADHSHRMDSIELAARKRLRNAAPVYMYRFDWESPVLDGLIKAAHTYEIPHVFDNAQLCSGMTGGDSDAVALAARMSSAWIAFARTGNPNVAHLPAWPAYDLERRATMLFNDVCEVAEDPGAAERGAWQPVRERRT